MESEQQEGTRGVREHREVERENGTAEKTGEVMKDLELVSLVDTATRRSVV
jgi:hypothetical protein